MNIHTLTEMRDFHHAAAEVLRKQSRDAWDCGLSNDKRITLSMHERFVIELDHAIAAEK